MNITLFGTGYVGLVSGVCLAELGNNVYCVDIDPQKIAKLKQGHSPIHENGLHELLQRNIATGRIKFTTEPKVGVEHAELIFIAVGTPRGPDGAADLSQVFTVANTIGQYITDYTLVLNKSTVPVGTADQVRECIQTQLQARGLEVEFDIASNPEFLREGVAIDDFMNPDRIIVGADTKRATTLLRELYTPLIDAGRRFIVMDTRSAELTKYASNAFLATKISFMNEMSHIAERLGADIEHIRHGMSLDPRIGEFFLNAGCGYGGSCFPKDVQALHKTAFDHGYEPRILTAVENTNRSQKRILFEKIQRYFQRNLKNKTIALWGLAFKPNTDDMRDASSRVLMELLWQEGANVQVYDPIAIENTRHIYGEHPQLTYCNSRDEALKNADVLAIVTEWDEFLNPDFSHIKKSLRESAIFDGRNLYDPKVLSEHELRYFAVGRGEII